MTFIGWLLGLTLFALFCTGGNWGLSIAFGLLYSVGYFVLGKPDR